MIRRLLQALAGRGELADAPLPVKSCPLNADPHPCSNREFHPDDPMAAIERDAKGVKVPRRFR